MPRQQSLLRPASGPLAACLAALLLVACGGASEAPPAAQPEVADLPTGEGRAQALTAAEPRAAAPRRPAYSLVSGPSWVASSPGSPLSSPASYVPVFSGTARYIDSRSGDDANPGTLQAPWRSLNRLTTASFAPGDAILLKCGETWRETLTLDTRQAPQGGVLIASYGDCRNGKRATVRASDWVSPTGWSRLDTMPGPVYGRAMNQSVGRLFLDGRPLIQARYPNFQGVGNEFALVQSVTSNVTTEFVVAPAERELFATRDLIGATVYLRVVQWQTHKALIRDYNPATGLVTLDTPMPFGIRPGSGYILEGKAWMLDSAGEWWQDPASRQLALWAPNGESPALLGGLEASWRRMNLEVKWAPNMRIERLALEQADVDGLELTETVGARVRDVVVSHSQELGISALNAHDVVIEDAQVVGAGHSGIVARESDRAVVRNNHVQDTGGFARAWASDAGINIIGINALAEGNLIERSALMGVRFGNRLGTVVRDNTVFHSCQRFTDCAGIYSYTGGSLSAMPSSYVPATLVEGNTIIGARSANEGCGYSCADVSHGIYLDELTTGVTLANNTISDTEIGIGLLNASFNRVRGNVVRNSGRIGLRALRTRADERPLRGNLIENNSFWVRSPMSTLPSGLPAESSVIHAMYWYDRTLPERLLNGTADNRVVGNRYLSTELPATATWTFASINSNRVLTPEQWAAHAPTDRQVNLLTYKRWIAQTGPELLSNSQFSSSIAGGWKSYLSPGGSGGSFQIAPFSSCRPSCGLFVAGSSADYLESNAFALKGAAGQNLYLLRARVQGGTGGGNRRVLIRRAVAPWENFGLSIPAQSVAPGQTAAVESFFLANASADNAVLSLAGTVGGQTFFRQASVVPVQSVEYPSITRLVSHLVNTRTHEVSIPCSATTLSSCAAVDENGATVAWPVTVPARSSLTVFSREGRWLY